MSRWFHLICLASLRTSLSARAAPISAENLEFFERHVRPVLVEKCYPCHSAESKSLKGELRLDFRDGLLRGGESGKPAIAPGDADGSMLIQAVRRSSAKLKMPPKGKLSDREIADLETWINAGAADPRDKPAATRAADKPTTVDHWSFKKLDPVEAPAVSSDWIKTPVDRFVLAKLQSAGLRPSPPADRRTLIRRATYDLTGLPPTPAEVEAFEKDQSADAFQRVVDRLLASPRYGERWGRHWLDLARYSDTKGYVYSDREERFFVHAHPYRDWVIRAFNQDMPYDRFLTLQIAADQAVPAEQLERDNSDLAAMGFLTLGRRFLGVSQDIIDDRIDTVMRTTQGLTVGCARCHDHKFDPIPTADYYSLYGVFANCSERYIRLNGKPDGSAEEIEKYEKELRKRADALTTTTLARRAEADARSRARTGDYLAATLDTSKLPVELFAMVLAPDDLNPLIAWRWHAYLLATKKAFDPVFEPWKALSALAPADFPSKAGEVLDGLAATDDPARRLNQVIVKSLAAQPLKSMQDVAKAYGAAFAEIDRRWLAVMDDPSVDRLPDDDADALRCILYSADSPAQVPAGPISEVEMFFPEGVRVELAKLQKEIDRLNIEAPGAPAYALILEDHQKLTEPRILKRGNPAMRGDQVPRQFLALLSDPQRQPFSHGSGRLELAQAIADPRNPLTARVMVNRVWAKHFGSGLAGTPSDLGTRCEPPTHPELLDWLAERFVAEGWSIKKLHRLVMLSSVYQQSANDAEADARRIDPENHLYWRMNRQRLDFEETRDSLLAASGELDLKIGGRPVEMFTAPFATRRSVYGLIDRQFLPGTLRVFDFANPDLHIPQRPMTTAPQQALYFMNSPFVAGRAKALLKRSEVASAADTATRVRALYEVLFQREPTAAQLETAEKFIEATSQDILPRDPPPSPWRYGYGEFDPTTQQLKSFTPLPHFTGEAWQGGERWPDAALGWARLTANGGHPGNDLHHAVVRRWIAPADGRVTIDGTLEHAAEPGDGVRGTILVAGKNAVAVLSVHHGSARSQIAGVAVKQGDTIDFIVDIHDSLSHDDFEWSPKVKLSSAETDGSKEWNATKDFAGPATTPPSLSAWEQYAQALLLSNEFIFVD